MKEIDLKWLQRIDDVHERMSRSVPLGAQGRRCTKEILLDRYFKFLEGRAFKLRIPISDTKYTLDEKMEYEIFYGLFTKLKHTAVHPEEGDELYHYSYGVRKHLGHNDHEFDISFIDEKMVRREFKLHWNGLLRISYEEIPIEEYWDVAKLFVDDTPKEKPSPNFNYCKHFDEFLCTSKDVEDEKCTGVNCGFYKETRK